MCALHRLELGDARPVGEDEGEGLLDVEQLVQLVHRSNDLLGLILSDRVCSRVLLHVVPQVEDRTSDHVVDRVHPALRARADDKLQLRDLDVAGGALKNDAPKVLSGCHGEDDPTPGTLQLFGSGLRLHGRSWVGRLGDLDLGRLCLASCSHLTGNHLAGRTRCPGIRRLGPMNLEVRKRGQKVSQSPADGLLQLILVLVAEAHAQVVRKTVKGHWPVRTSAGMHCHEDVLQFGHDLGHLLMPKIDLEDFGRRHTRCVGLAQRARGPLLQPPLDARNVEAVPTRQPSHGARATHHLEANRALLRGKRLLVNPGWLDGSLVHHAVDTCSRWLGGGNLCSTSRCLIGMILRFHGFRGGDECTGQL
mmetsp:Transcript_110641/g.298163  ORF Transcript_110641/g.298163 Transcript_110641/m.298163 type:complete len:363 (+) Transcript_110641:168-1256(+)